MLVEFGRLLLEHVIIARLLLLQLLVESIELQLLFDLLLVPLLILTLNLLFILLLVGLKVTNQIFQCLKFLLHLFLPFILKVVFDTRRLIFVAWAWQVELMMVPIGLRHLINGAY